VSFRAVAAVIAGGPAGTSAARDAPESSGDPGSALRRPPAHHRPRRLPEPSFIPRDPETSAPRKRIITNATPKMSRNTSVDSADEELKLPWRMSSTTSCEMVAVGEFDDEEIMIT